MLLADTVLSVTSVGTRITRKLNEAVASRVTLLTSLRKESVARSISGALPRKALSARKMARSMIIGSGA